MADATATMRTKDQIPLGSGKLYMIPFANTIPDVDTICVEDNRVGYIKSGASVEYVEETHEEKDDLGHVSKIITTKEEAKFKCGLITWNGETLNKILERCKISTDAKGRRVAKIGGAGNAQGKYYVICFHHEDKVDGDIWVLIKGRNTAGASFAFAMDNGSLLEPVFSALPHDAAGTLIEYIEQTTATTTSGN